MLFVPVNPHTHTPTYSQLLLSRQTMLSKLVFFNLFFNCLDTHNSKGYNRKIIHRPTYSPSPAADDKMNSLGYIFNSLAPGTSCCRPNILWMSRCILTFNKCLDTYQCSHDSLIVHTANYFYKHKRYLVILFFLFFLSRPT